MAYFIIKVYIYHTLKSYGDQLGVVARSCGPVTWKLGFENGLRVGLLPVSVLCRLDVRTKAGIDMDSFPEG